MLSVQPLIISRQVSGLVEWLEYPTPVREVRYPQESEKRYSVYSIGCHDYSTRDMSDLKRDCKKYDGRT